MAGTSGTKSKEVPCAVWDLTICMESTPVPALKATFNELFKKWVFQLERGAESGYMHYQCRVSVSPKKRQSAMIKYCRDIPRCHVSRTSNNSKDDDFYVMKVETRVDGPWKSTDPASGYIQERYRGTLEWKLWQRQMYGLIEPKADDRTVNLILETEGNKGKSFLICYLCQLGLARRIPPQESAKDILQFVMSFKPAKCYFIDLPRATSNRDQHAIYSALETLKDGYTYDSRYKGKERWFEPPHVWVITNVRPAEDLLSRDRWRFWTICSVRGLVPCGNQPLPPVVGEPGAAL